MPRRTAIDVQNQVTKGLVTEVTEISQQGELAKEIWDVQINSKGELTRRKGLDYEKNNSLKTIDRTGSAVSGSLWTNASGDGSVNIYVAQVNETLYFWRAEDPISTNALTPTVDLTTYSPSGAPSPGLNECEFTIGNGVLFVTHPYLETFFITYSSDTQITSTQINPKIRDLKGVDDSAAVSSVDDRPSYGTVAAMEGDADGVLHAYNLYNQGWAFDGGTATAPIDTWDSRSDMPSNADVWYAYKNSSGVFALTEVNNIDLGTRQAPRGHFILSVYNEDRDTASGLSGVPGFSTGASRCSTAAFFGGRLWLSGLRYKERQSTVYFSQVIQNDDDYGHMYGENDPTVEDLGDLLASDGGYITIQEAGTISKLFALSTGLMVFADNGVWVISGSSGAGFSATDYTVSKISSIDVPSRREFLEVNGLPFFWNDEGIYFAEQDSVQGIKITSLTQNSIETFFQEIPQGNKRYARGAYDPEERRIHWLYRSTVAGSAQENYEYDRILTFDLHQQAFIPWTISASDAKVHDIFTSQTASQDTQQEKVVTTGISNNGTATFTGGGSATITWTTHSLAVDEKVSFTTTGSLPTEITASTEYFVVSAPTADTFTISATEGGTAITFAGAGSGTHTATQVTDLVIESGGATQVVADVTSGSSTVNPGFKYLVSEPDGAGSYDFTFADHLDATNTYLDWATYEGTGIDYTSYLETGFFVKGEGLKRQSANYIQVFMDSEDGASLLVQPIWDWSHDEATNKEGTYQQCYNSGAGNYHVSRRRLRLRGLGSSLQLKFRSETGKPFTLLGYVIQDIVNPAV